MKIANGEIRTLAIKVKMALLLLAIAALLAACNKKKSNDEDAQRVSADTTNAIRVVTAVVEPRPFEDWGLYSADLRGLDDAVLTAPAPGGGRVNTVATVGKTVAKGQSLCNIDSDKYGAMLAQAKAALDYAQGELDRTKSNIDKGYVGKAVLDKSNLDYQSARVAYLQAVRAYQDSRCQAPFSGVLVSRFVEQFQSVPPGAPTVRVAGIRRLEVDVSIPESDAFDYREGQKAEFQVLQSGIKPVEGHIRSLDRAVEDRDRTVTARIEIPNPGKALKPGMIGKAHILRHRYEKALVVSSQAVLRLQEGTVIMRVVDGRAQKAAVTLGATAGDSVMVDAGLSAGDRIITVGAFQVSDGTKVEF